MYSHNVGVNMLVYYFALTLPLKSYDDSLEMHIFLLNPIIWIILADNPPPPRPLSKLFPHIRFLVRDTPISQRRPMRNGAFPYLNVVRNISGIDPCFGIFRSHCFTCYTQRDLTDCLFLQKEIVCLYLI